MTRMNHNRPSLRLKDNLEKIRKEMETAYRQSNSISEKNESEHLYWEPSEESDKNAWRVCMNVMQALQEEDDALVNSIQIISSRKEKGEQKKKLLANANKSSSDATQALEEAVIVYFVSALKAELNKDGYRIYRAFEKVMNNAARKGNFRALRLLEIMEKVREVFSSLEIIDSEKIS
ncbi:MAG: hypothetical protein KZQ97_19745 [Candidatus Thiodiazotropha sp. (ex Dulcina madagascariensis)]|nr:hypothetical protein [Candidatus Thiodiazotropha sp. (ex Dulcina madagascariensis)]